ncbi:MAG: hypothetical protein DWQ34_09270 [Planctomycetota bacterium]|nr:MAG: hypothetical protein DWQ34_09270 [Planctomycetota bacterium]REK20231.1 MAG: hypothetical protein DWQ41_26195 [Planctomycetota bacterium]REK35315.1 MAG: hypothetical protein DWQ45_11325 [Planctomycetota bacterium]
MRGYILLRDNPYMAASDRHGRFSVKHLPAGEHTFQLWHERSGYLRNVQFGSQQSDAKGRVTLIIGEGANEASVTRLDPALFENE